MSTSFFQFYSLTQLFLPFSTPVLTGLRMRRRALNRDCSSCMKRVKWKELMKRVTFFSCACAAWCWDTVSNPGLIAVRLVKRAPLRPLFLSINGYWHSENQFEEVEQDWLVQKFGLRWLHRLDVIEVERTFLLHNQEDRMRFRSKGGRLHTHGPKMQQQTN